MLLSFIEVLIVIVPLLLSVAFMTIAERKAMGSMQRRLGPNRVGYYGLLQPLSKWLPLY
jgi:NADH-ubiquinone oxidoreductase chain 1